jgi:hypothetical protein
VHRIRGRVKRLCGTLQHLAHKPHSKDVSFILLLDKGTRSPSDSLRGTRCGVCARDPIQGHVNGSGTRSEVVKPGGNAKNFRAANPRVNTRNAV